MLFRAETSSGFILRMMNVHAILDEAMPLGFYFMISFLIRLFLVSFSLTQKSNALITGSAA